MAYGKQIQEYQKHAINGASPLQLVIMLYDGALRFMEAGKHAMALRDNDTQNTSLQKAQRIIQELMSCLDMQQGGEIAKNLFAIYTFTFNTLVEANVGDDPRAIDSCIAILSDLRESWFKVEAGMRSESGPTETSFAA